MNALTASDTSDECAYDDNSDDDDDNDDSKFLLTRNPGILDQVLRNTQLEGHDSDLDVKQNKERLEKNSCSSQEDEDFFDNVSLKIAHEQDKNKKARQEKKDRGRLALARLHHIQKCIAKHMKYLLFFAFLWTAFLAISVSVYHILFDKCTEQKFLTEISISVLAFLFVEMMVSFILSAVSYRKLNAMVDSADAKEFLASLDKFSAASNVCWNLFEKHSNIKIDDDNDHNVKKPSLRLHQHLLLKKAEKQNTLYSSLMNVGNKVAAYSLINDEIKHRRPEKNDPSLCDKMNSESEIEESDTDKQRKSLLSLLKIKQKFLEKPLQDRETKPKPKKKNLIPRKISHRSKSFFLNSLKVVNATQFVEFATVIFWIVFAVHYLIGNTNKELRTRLECRWAAAWNFFLILPVFIFSVFRTVPFLARWFPIVFQKTFQKK